MHLWARFCVAQLFVPLAAVKDKKLKASDKNQK